MSWISACTTLRRLNCWGKFEVHMIVSLLREKSRHCRHTPVHVSLSGLLQRACTHRILQTDIASVNRRFCFGWVYGLYFQGYIRGSKTPCKLKRWSLRDNRRRRRYWLRWTLVMVRIFRLGREIVHHAHKRKKMDHESVPLVRFESSSQYLFLAILA